MGNNIKQLDDLWSLLVKLRAGKECEICCKTEYVQSHHIIPRTKYGTRWNLENGVALCRHHHLYFAHKDVLAFYDWIKDKRDLKKLELSRHNKPDKAAIMIYLENELKKYD